jgi:hypothetical protein
MTKTTPTTKRRKYSIEMCTWPKRTKDPGGVEENKNGVTSTLQVLKLAEGAKNNRHTRKVTKRGSQHVRREQ